MALQAWSPKKFGDDKSRMFESIRILRSLGDKLGLAEALRWAGEPTLFKDEAQAHIRLDESIKLFREIGHISGLIDALNFKNTQ